MLPPQHNWEKILVVQEQDRVVKAFCAVRPKTVSGTLVKAHSVLMYERAEESRIKACSRFDRVRQLSMWLKQPTINDTVASEFLVQSGEITEDGIGNSAITVRLSSAIVALKWDNETEGERKGYY